MNKNLYETANGSINHINGALSRKINVFSVFQTKKALPLFR
jgi:hypothetical protein